MISSNRRKGVGFLIALALACKDSATQTSAEEKTEVSVAALSAAGKPDLATGKAAAERAAAERAAVGVDDYTELESVPNAGLLKGTIGYAGNRESLRLNVSKDARVCTHGGEPDGSLVATGGKLKNVVVAIQDEIKQGKRWEGGRAILDNRECLFEPRIQIARQWGQVETKNSDALLHNANLAWVDGDKRETLANVPLPPQGRPQTKDIKRAGLVEVGCDVHDWMRAWLYVSKHPYAAITGADGTYQITGIPAGKYTAMIWHEALGRIEVAVEVAPGSTVTLNHSFQ